MKWTHVIWDFTRGGNVEHVEEHGLSASEVNDVLENYDTTGNSRSTGRPCVFGYTQDGRHVVVFYDELDADTIFPITAYVIDEP